MATYNQAAMDADTAEALSRAEESRANVFRQHALAGKDEGGTFKGLYEEASTNSADMFRRAGEMRPSGVQDPEGTVHPLADRRGSFADNVDQANSGGIGIFDSNTRQLEPGEGTPSSRLNPETTRAEQVFAPSSDQLNLNELMPKGDKVSDEDQENADRARLSANLGGAPLLQTQGSSEDEPSKGRSGRPWVNPKKGKATTE